MNMYFQIALVIVCCISAGMLLEAKLELKAIKEQLKQLLEKKG